MLCGSIINYNILMQTALHDIHNWAIHDIIYEICKWLSASNKMIFLSVNVSMDKLKDLFTFDKRVRIEKIIGHRYYDQFINIRIPYRMHISKLPENMSRLKFNGEEPFPPAINFSKITHMYLYQECDKYMWHKFINLTHLELDMWYNNSIGVLPPTITHLSLGAIFNQSIDNLPPNVKYLQLGGYFNQPIDHLPHSLTHLKIGYNFNKSIDHLPPNIVYLELCHGFNKHINNLPQNIKYLICGNEFDKPVDNLPKNITHLRLGCKFTQRIDNLPQSITHLSIGPFFDKPIDHLPGNIIELSISNQYQYPIPNNVKHIIRYDFVRENVYAEFLDNGDIIEWH